MTDVVTLFTDKHSGQSFSDFDERTDAHISTEYKHMKKYFWSGELPRLSDTTVNRIRAPKSRLSSFLLTTLLATTVIATSCMLSWR